MVEGPSQIPNDPSCRTKLNIKLSKHRRVVIVDSRDSSNTKHVHIRRCIQNDCRFTFEPIYARSSMDIITPIVTNWSTAAWLLAIYTAEAKHEIRSNSPPTGRLER